MVLAHGHRASPRAIFLCSCPGLDSFSRLDTSPSVGAISIRTRGWQGRPYGWARQSTGCRARCRPPSFALLDSAPRPRRCPRAPANPRTSNWRGIWKFGPVVLVHPRPARAVRGGCSFRSVQTYAIEYLQHVKGLTLQGGRPNVNSGVFCGGGYSPHHCFGPARGTALGHRAMMLSLGTLAAADHFHRLGASRI